MERSQEPLSWRPFRRSETAFGPPFGPVPGKEVHTAGEVKQHKAVLVLFLVLFSFL